MMKKKTSSELCKSKLTLCLCPATTIVPTGIMDNDRSEPSRTRVQRDRSNEIKIATQGQTENTSIQSRDHHSTTDCRLNPAGITN